MSPKCAFIQNGFLGILWRAAVRIRRPPVMNLILAQTTLAHDLLSVFATGTLESVRVEGKDPRKL